MEKLVELKNTISKIKNSLNAFNSRIEMREERVSEFDVKTTEILQSERQNKILKKMNSASWTCETIQIVFISLKSQKNSTRVHCNIYSAHMLAE